MVSYAGSDNHYESLAMANVSNQLAQGDHNATLSDYRTIRNSEKIKFPRDITEVGITLSRSYAVLCQCLFQDTGPQHPFVNAMWTLSMGIQNNAPFISERYYNISRTPAVASIFCACSTCGPGAGSGVPTSSGDKRGGGHCRSGASQLQWLDPRAQARYIPPIH